MKLVGRCWPCEPGLRLPVGVGWGPQILLKEYSFDSRHKPAFTEEDVLNIFPVVKHVNPKASDAFHFFQSGQAKVQQGACQVRPPGGGVGAGGAGRSTGPTGRGTLRNGGSTLL